MFYSPSSTESAKRGENGQLVSKKQKKASTDMKWRSRERGKGSQYNIIKTVVLSKTFR